MGVEWELSGSGDDGGNYSEHDMIPVWSELVIIYLAHLHKSHVLTTHTHRSGESNAPNAPESNEYDE